MSIVARREREKKKRRRDIINAAEKLFFFRGYDYVSMKDISLEAELSKATLYLYFQNKESLFFAIVFRGTRILNSMIREAVEKEDKGINRVDAFRKAYHEFTKQYPDYIQIYNYFQSGRFNLASENRRTENHADVSIPFVRGCTMEILKLRKEMFLILCNSVQRGIDDGTIRQDLDPVEVAVLLSAISKSLSHVPPDHEKVLESCGITLEKYFMDVGEIIQHMLTIIHGMKK